MPVLYILLYLLAVRVAQSISHSNKCVYFAVFGSSYGHVNGHTACPFRTRLGAPQHKFSSPIKFHIIKVIYKGVKRKK
jgi:hypothetical protein